MKLKGLAIALACLLSVGCTSSDKALKTLERQGYTDIRIDGYAFLSCSEDDTFKTSFEATAPNGERVTGAVCSGLFKGNTVRLD